MITTHFWSTAKFKYRETRNFANSANSAESKCHEKQFLRTKTKSWRENKEKNNSRCF